MIRKNKDGVYMKCPCCEKEMISGVIQSARQIFFTIP